MKRILLSLFATIISVSASFAQFGTAPDFTVTDLDGNTHHLYDILDQGYVVVLDVSATWCGTCWSVHNAHYLRDLNSQMGPDGTNEVRVIFYEGDASTTLADLQGTGTNTHGNWLNGINYPVINESSPLSLSSSVYWPLGFPTINVIRPGDREITADVWNQNLQGMINAVNHAIATDPSSVDESFIAEHGISIYPNPTADDLQLNLGTGNDVVSNVVVRNLLGQTIISVATNGNKRVQLNTHTLADGAYLLELQSDNAVLGVQKFLKN